MSRLVISVENLSKIYSLGQIGTGTFTNDLKVWWARVRGKPNPLLRIGESDHGNREGEDLWALRDISFTVEQGEVLGIIGRNGAGKSTLLKILSRVTAPTSGKIKVKGRIASLLEVGTGFHPDLTGRENIYLNGAILGMSRKEVERKFDEIVDFAEVEKFIDTPVKRYSSGMYVRLAFAVAAHLEPEILVVDEVLAVGDAEFQKKCLGKMGDVAKEGRTVLFVSHNMASVGYLCRRGMILKNGQLNLYGDIEQVVSAYQSSPKGKLIVEIENSHGADRPVITRCCVIDEQFNPIKNISMGSTFGLQVEFSSPFPITNPGLGIRINTYQGITLLGCTDQMHSNQSLGKSVTSGVFRVTFNNPNINQGDYTIALTLSDNSVSLAKYPNILGFTVDPVDIYGTGKIPSNSQSLITVPANWELIPKNQGKWER